MKMKRILSASIAGIMAIGLLAGCNGGNTTSNSEQFQDSEEKLTLKWLGNPTNAGASEGSVPETTLEERFNVEIEPLFYENNKFNDKKTMLMAGGEIPDLIYELDPINVVNDVDQDFIVEVPYETVKEYAPTYYAYLSEYAPGAWMYSRYEDKNWGVPNYDHGFMQNYQAYYRGDWLDKFGLEVPKTIDEMYTALYKMSNEDPDGNGKKDTYGISANDGTYQHYFSEIFGAYGVMPFDWQEADDGSIVYGGVTDKCKEVLQMLANWYSEGIVHPDFMVGNPDGDKFGSGQLGYMVLKAYFDPADTSTSPYIVKENTGGYMVAGFLPEGPDGDHGKRAWGRPAHVVSFGNTEGHGVKVPRMLKIMEGIHTDADLWKTLKIGNEGEQWEALPADSTAEYGFKMIGDYTSNGARTNGLHVKMEAPSMFVPVGTTYENYLATKTDAWRAWADEYVDESYCITDYFYKPDIVPSSADYLIDLRTKQMALMSEIITGVKSIDDYAEFVSQWENGGGKIMTEEANELKDEMKEVYKEIGIN